MKKLFAILPIVIFLISVSLASAALQINETSISATSNPGATFSKQITLINTGSSAISVNFTGLSLACVGNPSKTISAIVSSQTIPANSTVPVSLLFSIGAKQLACTYEGTIIASSGSFADSVAADITINALPSVSVTNKAMTILKNITSVTSLDVSLQNTGNTPLNIIYKYSNFSYSGKVLVLGSASSDVIDVDSTHTVSIPVGVDSSLPDGDYISTLQLNGTVNSAYPLTITLKSPVVSVSLPDFTMPESERNKTVTQTFTITNNGDYPLENVALSTDASSDYKVAISGMPGYLAPGDNAVVTISAFVPDDEKTTIHSIGNLLFKSDRISNTVPLKLNVASKLRIEEVIIKIDSSSKTLKSNGDELDDSDTHPGATFEVEVKVCNKYDDSDYSISGVTGTLTFEEADNGEDIDGEIADFDLDGDECKTVSATFDKNYIDYLTTEGTYNLKVEIEGDDDEYDITQSDEWDVDVRVYRASSAEVLFDTVSVNPTTANCGGTADLKVLAYNIGGRDSDSKLRIYNADLGIDINKFFKIGDDPDKDCDAVNEPDEKCAEIDHTFKLSIPSDAKTGAYSIEVMAYRGETRETDKETITLNVNCGSSSTSTGTGTSGTAATGTSTGTTSGTGSVVVTPSPSSSSSRTAGTPVKITDISSGNNLWLVGLIAGNVLLVIIIILVVLAVFKSKP